VARSEQMEGHLAIAKKRARVSGPLILAIGHSTRTIEAFIAMLEAHGVKRVVDVRTIPRSRHNPQFNRDTLPETLRHAGIAYTHMEALGGLRTQVLIHSIRDGVTLRSVATPITCKRQNLKRAWKH